jgi:hypothetical protein
MHFASPRVRAGAASSRGAASSAAGATARVRGAATRSASRAAQLARIIPSPLRALSARCANEAPAPASRVSGSRDAASGSVRPAAPAVSRSACRACSSKIGTAQSASS